MDRLAEARVAFEKAFIRKKLKEKNSDIDKTAAAIGVNPKYIEEAMER